MNKKLSLALAFLPLLVWICNSGCKKADIKFGEEFLDNDITQIYKTDSFGVDVSTVYLDSFVTSNKGAVLVGAYTDPLFGTVTTASYFEMTPPYYVDPANYTGTTFDSIVLILKPTIGSHYGDSTKPLTVNAYELKDSISTPENVYSIYNTANFNTKPALLGSTGTIIRPNADSIIIRLNDAMGNDFLNRLKSTTDPTMKSAAAFLSFFKGIKLTTNSTSEMIVACSDAVIMRLHYKLNTINNQHGYTDFTVANKLHQFNNISIVRSGPISTLGPANRVIPSTATGNTSYCQAATGSMIKLTFPTIKDVLKIPNFAKVLKASLIIRPVKSSYSTTFSLPFNMRLSTTDANNKIGEDLAYVTNNGAVAIQYGLLQTDYFQGDKTFYTYDLTEYVKHILRTSTITPGEGLLFTPPTPDFENQFARVAIGNRNNSLGKIELQIYYAAVK